MAKAKMVTLIHRDGKTVKTVPETVARVLLGKFDKRTERISRWSVKA